MEQEIITRKGDPYEYVRDGKGGWKARKKGSDTWLTARGNALAAIEEAFGPATQEVEINELDFSPSTNREPEGTDALRRELFGGPVPTNVQERDGYGIEDPVKSVGIVVKTPEITRASIEGDPNDHRSLRNREPEGTQMLRDELFKPYEEEEWRPNPGTRNHSLISELMGGDRMPSQRDNQSYGQDPRIRRQEEDPNSEMMEMYRQWQQMNGM